MASRRLVRSKIDRIFRKISVLFIYLSQMHAMFHAGIASREREHHDGFSMQSVRGRQEKKKEREREKKKNTKLAPCNVGRIN